MCAKKCKVKCNKTKCDSKCAPENTQNVRASITVPAPVIAAATGVNVRAAESKQPTTVAITDPPAAIRDGGLEFHKLYSQYVELSKLAKPLHGLPQNEAFPSNISVSRVVIEFSVDGETHAAEIPGVKIIGEISGVIGSGLRNLIDQMYQTLFTLNHVTASMQTTVQNAATPKGSMSLKAQDNEKAV
jgi:hypothetical protein